jgi:hypothetical protein
VVRQQRFVSASTGVELRPVTRSTYNASTGRFEPRVTYQATNASGERVSGSRANPEWTPRNPSSNPPIEQIRREQTGGGGVGGTTRSMETSTRWLTGY